MSGESIPVNTRYCTTCFKLWKIQGKMPDYHWHVVDLTIPVVSSGNVIKGDLVTINFGSG